MLFKGFVVTALLSLAAPIFGAAVVDTNLAPRAISAANCPGYVASNVKTSGNTLTADLKLNGKACNVYGTDIGPLKLLVEYQTSKCFCTTLSLFFN